MPVERLNASTRFPPHPIQKKLNAPLNTKKQLERFSEFLDVSHIPARFRTARPIRVPAKAHGLSSLSANRKILLSFLGAKFWRTACIWVIIPAGQVID